MKQKWSAKNWTNCWVLTKIANLNRRPIFNAKLLCCAVNFLFLVVYFKCPSNWRCCAFFSKRHFIWLDLQLLGLRLKFQKKTESFVDLALQLFVLGPSFIETACIIYNSNNYKLLRIIKIAHTTLTCRSVSKPNCCFPLLKF